VRGPGSHVREPRISAHEQGEHRFAGKLLERVTRASQSGEFEALVLVADARTLGNIRRQMGKSLRRQVILELSLDLTGLDSAKLEKRLRTALDWPPA
jgi:protein required for attachment to host cells